MAQAEAAIVQMAQGDFAGAAHHARLALQTAGDDPTIYALAGSILLNTDDDAGALTAFENAVASSPNDSLALYGRGLAQLARGDRAAALDSFQRSERNGGNQVYLLIARRYAQWLGGAQVAMSGAGLPEALSSAQHALQGVAAARRGDPQQETVELQAALKALPGSPVVQPGGLLMSFEAARPLDTGADRLPAPNGLDLPPVAKEPALSGEVVLVPDGVTSSVAYVAYDVDGKSFNLVNVPPYRYNWDSRRAPNGWHTVTVELFDSAGKEIARTTRRLRTRNREADVMAAVPPERLAQLRVALWQALTLRPDRGACAYLLGTAYRALGATAPARMWLARAAAIRPGYRDTRRQLAACGLSEGGPALWGGLPTEKVIALTFDDGPKPGVTEPLLAILRQERVPATFFVIGRHVLEYPDLTRQIVTAGMEIANHSFTHRNLTKLSADEAEREIMQTQAAVQTVTGKIPHFLRPPGGNWNDAVAAATRRWGLTPCFWTVDVYGSEVIGAQQVADAVLRQVQPGSIILMHNGKMSTMQALPTIIRELRKRGYSFATVETLAHRLNVSKEAQRNAARLAAAANSQRSE